MAKPRCASLVGLSSSLILTSVLHYQYTSCCKSGRNVRWFRWRRNGRGRHHHHGRAIRGQRQRRAWLRLLSGLCFGDLVHRHNLGLFVPRVHVHDLGDDDAKDSKHEGDKAPPIAVLVELDIRVEQSLVDALVAGVVRLFLGALFQRRRDIVLGLL